MDLVDEQHVAVVELRQDGGEVTGALEGRPRREVHLHVHLVGDDAGEGGLAEPGGPGEEEVVGGLAAATRRLEDDAEAFLQLGLADELAEGPRPQRGDVGARQRRGIREVDLEVAIAGRGVEQFVPHQAAASRWSAARSSSELSPSGGSSRSAPAISSSP